MLPNARHISNAAKLHRIIKQHPLHFPDDPFIFQPSEAYQIRCLIGASLVMFFKKLKENFSN